MTPSSETPIRVLLVDDDPMVRAYVGGFLAGDPGLEVVGSVPDSDAALAVLSRTEVDVVLLDLVMPGVDGVEATGLFLEQAPGLRILILTSLDDGERVGRALAQGAVGSLTKDLPANALVQAVRAAHSGLRVMTPPSFAHIVSQQRPHRSPDAPELSQREQEVLDLLCAGHSNNEIGRRLFLAPSTVKGVVSTLISKLGAVSRLHAVARAHELGLGRLHP
ncbi:MAG: response regulator transcription factor [Propionibacteriaceae bacterium]|nr:response regulator transcription factor [Propionibacteriaceae bacterium]